MKKLSSLLALCVFSMVLVSVSNAQGLVLEPPTRVIQNDPCPPCPPVVSNVVGHPRPTVIPRKQCGDVIVNLNCTGDVHSCGYSAPMNPPNGESSPVFYPMDYSLGGVLPFGALLLWLIILTVAVTVALTIGLTQNKGNRNENLRSSTRAQEHHYHPTVYVDIHHNYHAPAGMAPSGGKKPEEKPKEE